MRRHLTRKQRSYLTQLLSIDDIGIMNKINLREYRRTITSDGVVSYQKWKVDSIGLMDDVDRDWIEKIIERGWYDDTDKIRLTKFSMITKKVYSVMKT